MTILYTIDKSLYVNVTNACPCNCTFCVRLEHNSIGECDNLWLEHEPTLEEIIEAFKKQNLEAYDQVVFCGYGEPLVRLDIVLEVCKWIKAHSNRPIRINTNGLANLIHQREIAYLLEGAVDAISISLNAPNKERYLEIARPCFRIDSFESLIQFAQACKKVIPRVTFSVVDVLSHEEIEACQRLATDMNISLRVRERIK